MAKVLRLHDGASDTISGWGNSVKIGGRAIDGIADPNGAEKSREITSIPSPFARMDLVKEAFRVVANGDLSGNTIYHKLVSDSLDVGQIFFNIEQYRGIVEIMAWDKSAGIQRLLNAPNPAHRGLGKTLDMFLREDGATYNFGKMDRICLLNYKLGPKQVNIIGATSPATVFFTSANDLSYVSGRIRFGQDSPFDDDYKPLYERDQNYVRWWWSLMKAFPDFPDLFPEVNGYLQKCYTNLSESLRAELQGLSGDSYQSNYRDIPVVQDCQDYVSVLGRNLRCKGNAAIVDSDFQMRVSPASRFAGRKIPLALPVDTYTTSARYVVDNWDVHTHVPYYDDKPVADRVLPDDGTKWPYVTVGDFLEDTIIKINHKFNKDSFFNGNDDAPDGESCYLLPLRKGFFDWFQVSDLTGMVGRPNANGGLQRMMEIRRLAAGCVKVILRIPVMGGDGYVQYYRIYSDGDEYDRGSNKGRIVERNLTISVLPTINYSDGITPFYRVCLVDGDTLSRRGVTPLSLNFYDGMNGEVLPDDCVKRNRTSDGTRCDIDIPDSVIYSMSSQYQYIAVTDVSSGSSAVVVPCFVDRTGGKAFRFAVDFGTTNTHVEYSVDGGQPRPFAIGDDERQIQRLTTACDYYSDTVLISDMMPDTIGAGDGEFRYPMRTALLEYVGMDWNQGISVMADVNIPFTYEKKLPKPYDVLHTDLKWSTEEVDRRRATAYIECLLVMLRNKVLLNNGDLAKTELVWFYPVSMTQSRFNRFRDIWETTFTKLFNAPAANIVTIPESIAPYHYLRRNLGATSTCVCIDIGGGSTDVLFVRDGVPQYLTSFRFAANAMFGDGYAYNSDTNGFVREYCQRVLDILDKNHLPDLKGVLEGLMERKSSVGIVSFLFSLAENKDVRQKGVEKSLDFSEMLANDQRGKYVMILFYVAVLYHIANVMKSQGLDMPRHIAFSGNGSKMLDILSSDGPTVEKFTKLIFERIYRQGYTVDGLTIIRPTDPKAATCKGGIAMESFLSQDYGSVASMKSVSLGLGGNAAGHAPLSYDQIDEGGLDAIVGQVKDFLDFAFGLDAVFPFHEWFDVSRSLLAGVKQICQRDIRNYLKVGIEKKRAMIERDGGNGLVEETLFFYPLIGILNAISREVYGLQC